MKELREEKSTGGACGVDKAVHVEDQFASSLVEDSHRFGFQKQLVTALFFFSPFWLLTVLVPQRDAP